MEGALGEAPGGSCLQWHILPNLASVPMDWTARHIQLRPGS